jgi:hypothetical protein
MLYYIEALSDEADERHLNSIITGLVKYLDAYNGFLKRAIEIVQTHHQETSRPHDMAVLVLARHVMAQVDGVSVLVRQGCGECCGPLLRSAFEAFYGLKYIFQNESEVERRALCYLVAHYRKLLAKVAELDKATPEGAKLRTELTGEKAAALFDRDHPDLAEHVATIKANLALSVVASIDHEWIRLKATNEYKRKDPHWYSLFDGPKSFSELLKKKWLDQYAVYKILYEEWSRTVHAGDGLDRLLSDQRGFALRPIRHPAEVQPATRMAALVCELTTALLVKAYAPLRMAEFAIELGKQVGPMRQMIKTKKLVDVPWR